MLGLVQGLATSLKPDTVASPLRASGNRTITAPGFALLAGAVHLTPHNARLAGR